MARQPLIFLLVSPSPIPSIPFKVTDCDIESVDWDQANGVGVPPQRISQVIWMKLPAAVAQPRDDTHAGKSSRDGSNLRATFARKHAAGGMDGCTRPRPREETKEKKKIILLVVEEVVRPFLLSSDHDLVARGHTVVFHLISIHFPPSQQVSQSVTCSLCGGNGDGRLES